MTLYAIFSDIHANYAALRAAVRDARALARREHAANLEFISLGDVVDYGPQPNECVAWVQRYASITIQGNHDQAATEPLASPPLEIDQELWPIVLWTRAELRDRNKQALHRWRGYPGASELRTWFTPFHSNIDESGVYLNTARAAKRRSSSSRRRMVCSAIPICRAITRKSAGRSVLGWSALTMRYRQHQVQSSTSR